MTTAERLNAIPLGEAMFTQRAIRRFKKDPIPDDVLEDIMQATIRAPNGGNTQPWRFIVCEGRRKAPEAGRALP
ncbi:NADH dehydrogenase [Geodia barretti]|uniref:NADH dehydrogenase n=1 Tax=Geodia barretti TaxID=519541 RepID=A0AA35SG70_GEOBA|nr:NADH dehydrogenase [Geodia barretti]